MNPRKSATGVATCLLLAMVAVLAAGQEQLERESQLEGQTPGELTGLSHELHEESPPAASANQRRHQQHEQPEIGPSSKRNMGAPVVGLPFQVDILRWLAETMIGPKEKGHAKAMLEEQDSDSSASHLSTCQLLDRAHFMYETFNSTSDDGYITQLIRIVNPHLRETRPVPVVFYGGLGVSPAAFLAAAASEGTRAQNWQARDWPAATTNSSRSLALTLANNGYEVWLVAARGCDEANRGRVAPRIGGAMSPDPTEAVHGKTGDLLFKSAQSHLQQFQDKQSHLDYWSFSADEIIKFEFGRQLELVLEASGQSQLSLVSYSSGALVSFALMASRPDFVARHVAFHASIGPAVYVNKFNVVLSAAGLASQLSPPGWSFPHDQLDLLARGTFLQVCKSKVVRYSTCKMLLDSLYGFSDSFQSKLDLAMFEYIARPTSARALSQILQVGYSGQLRCYDYGIFGNLLVYQQLTPPDYQLKALRPAGATKFLLVAGERDAIVDPSSVQELAKQIGGSGDLHQRTDEQKQQQQQHHQQHHQNQNQNHQEQVESVLVKGYNHLDLLAGRDVEAKVNRLVLERLQDIDLEASYPNEHGQEGGSQQEEPESPEEPNYDLRPSEGSRQVGKKGVLGLSSARQLQKRPEAAEKQQELEVDQIRPQVKRPHKAQTTQPATFQQEPQQLGDTDDGGGQDRPRQPLRANKAVGSNARQLNGAKGLKPIERLRRTD